MGANNPQTIRLIDDINETSTEKHEILGWVDNDLTKEGRIFFGFSVLGPPDILSTQKYRDVFVVNNITRNGIVRRETSKQLLSYDLPFASLIHPNINTKYVSIGEGVVVHEGVLIEANCKISSYCAIGSGTIIGHETTVGEFTFVGINVSIAGGVIIGQAVTIWTSAVIGPRVRIGYESIIGANSTVLSNIEPNSTLAGNPARTILRGRKDV